MWCQQHHKVLRGYYNNHDVSLVVGSNPLNTTHKGQTGANMIHPIPIEALDSVKSKKLNLPKAPVVYKKQNPNEQVVYGMAEKRRGTSPQF